MAEQQLDGAQIGAGLGKGGKTRYLPLPAPPARERTIALKSVMGRIDHLAVDLGRQRLFVAELGNSTVDAIDIARGSVIRRIEGLKEPQGLACAECRCARCSPRWRWHGASLPRCRFVSYRHRDLGDDADNVRLNARTGNFVVGYGSGGLAVIDPGKGAVLQHIPLPAHPESFQLDPDKGRAFVNLPDDHQIAVVDFNAGQKIASWQVPDHLAANFPMALDAARSTGAVVFRTSPNRSDTRARADGWLRLSGAGGPANDHSRLEKQVEAERDRVNEARSEVGRLRGEMTDLTARADRAEQASTLADAARQEAVQATEALRRADADRKARGLVARLRAAWRGE
jgi:hypothetical protein